MMSRFKIRPDKNFVRFGVLLPAAGYFAIRLLLADPMPAETVASGELEVGRKSELVAVFISATFCGANGTEGFAGAVKRMNPLLEKRVTGEGKEFRSIGISIDWDPYVGIEYLQNMGEFDEITSGGNWLNTATEKYVWGDFPGTNGIPQVLLFERVINQGATSVGISEERLLLQKIGPEQIIQWVEEGVPYPTSASLATGITSGIGASASSPRE